LPLYGTTNEDQIALNEARAAAAAKAAAAQAAQDKTTKQYTPASNVDILNGHRPGATPINQANPVTYQEPNAGQKGTSLQHLEPGAQPSTTQQFTKANTVLTNYVSQGDQIISKGGAGYDWSKYPGGYEGFKQDVAKAKADLAANNQNLLKYRQAKQNAMQGSESALANTVFDTGAYEREAEVNSQDRMLTPSQMRAENEAEFGSPQAAAGRLIAAGVIAPVVVDSTIHLGSTSSMPSGKGEAYKLNVDPGILNGVQKNDLKSLGFDISAPKPETTSDNSFTIGPFANPVNWNQAKKLGNAVISKIDLISEDIAGVGENMVTRAAEEKGKGNNLAAGALFAAGGAVSGVGGFAWGVATLPLQIARLPSTAYTLATNPEARGRAAAAILANPLSTAVQIGIVAGGLVYGGAAKAGLLDEEATTELPVRLRYPERSYAWQLEKEPMGRGITWDREFNVQDYEGSENLPSRYDLPSKPYGRQYTLTRESIPQVEENFGGANPIRVAGEGWGNSKTPGFGLTRTGGDLIPSLVDPEKAVMVDVWRGEWKQFYGYKPSSVAPVTPEVDNSISVLTSVENSNFFKGGVTPAASSTRLIISTSTRPVNLSSLFYSSAALTRLGVRSDTLADTSVKVMQRQVSALDLSQNTIQGQKVVTQQQTRLVTVQDQEPIQLQRQLPVQVQETKINVIPTPSLKAPVRPAPPPSKYTPPYSPTPISFWKNPPPLDIVPFTKPGSSAKGKPATLSIKRQRLRVEHKGRKLTEEVFGKK